MAIHYNLEKVHLQTNSDSEKLRSAIVSFVQNTPDDLKKLSKCIKNKEYESSIEVANQIKKSLDLMGMTIAHNEIEAVQNWATSKGKRKEITSNIETAKQLVDNAIKEIQKDFVVL